MVLGNVVVRWHAHVRLILWHDLQTMRSILILLIISHVQITNWQWPWIFHFGTCILVSQCSYISMRRYFTDSGCQLATEIITVRTDDII